MNIVRAKDEKERIVAGVVRDLRRRFGEGAIVRLGDCPYREVGVIPTGSLLLDLALGVGGIPCGRVTEICGPESSGKTTLCQHVIAEAQRRGGIAVFIDVEHALDLGYAARCGVSVDNLFVARPGTGEQALEIADALVRCDVAVVVVDSAAALTPRAEIEGEPEGPPWGMGDNHAGLQVRLIPKEGDLQVSQALGKLVSSLEHSNTAVIFTNQLRYKTGMAFGNPETTTGGQARRHYASVRLEVRRGQAIKEGGEIIGSRVKVTVKENEVAPPCQVAEFDILFNQGIGKVGDVLDTAASLKVVSKVGRDYCYSGLSLGRGHAGDVRRLSEAPELALAIERQVRQAAGVDGVDPGSSLTLTVPAASHGTLH
jgi:recombination protein RecA